MNTVTHTLSRIRSHYAPTRQQSNKNILYKCLNCQITDFNVNPPHVWHNLFALKLVFRSPKSWSFKVHVTQYEITVFPKAGCMKSPFPKGWAWSKSWSSTHTWPPRTSPSPAPPSTSTPASPTTHLVLGCGGLGSQALNVLCATSNHVFGISKESSIHLEKKKKH
jgi:hypothetical protein